MLLKSGIIVAFFTMVSRVFGLARDVFIATIFGTSWIADCVAIAFKFPNLFRRIFGEGALSVVFIPIFTEKLLESKESASRFSGDVITLLFIVLVGLSTMIQLFMPYLMILIAPGFRLEPEKYELAISLCRITTPYLIFVSIIAIFGGMLNSVKKFAAFAVTPVIMNICVILFTYFFENSIKAEFAISYSLIFAGVIQIIFMLFCLFRAKLLFTPSVNFADNDVKRLLKNMSPAVMSSGVLQINLFISQSIATFIPGAVSILYYAERLYQLPLSLIGVTFATILLPELSQIYKKKKFKHANDLQNKAIVISLAISVPAMVGLFILAAPIIHLICERGAFTASDTFKTASALSAFSLGLPAFVLSKVLTPVFYANGDTKTPFRITVSSLIVNVVLNIILMIPLSYVGIAAGSSIAGWYNVWLLNNGAKKYGNFNISLKTKEFIYKILISALVMLVFLVLLVYFFHYLYYSENFLIKAIFLTFTIFVAMIIYLAMLYFFKFNATLINKIDD